MDSSFAVNRPCVILAGAGTGKTRAITLKARDLIKNNIFSSQKIACITFSNEAVASLESRLKSFLEEHEMPLVRTFHGMCGDLLREYGHKIGLKNSFRIITPEDAMIMLYQYFKIHANLCGKYVESIGSLKESNYDIQEYEKILSDELKRFPEIEKDLEKAKLKLHSGKVEKVEKNELKELVDRLGNLMQQKRFLMAWKSYEKIKTKQGLMDYGDLQQRALELLKKNPEIASNFDYVIVDEFQDTNRIQLDLIHCLAPKGNVTIVGDLNQSIYQFRGAYSATFEEFKRRYETQEIVKLDSSHRSPNKVLRIAHKTIRNNYENPEDCFEVNNANGEDGQEIKVCELINSREEVRKIVGFIDEEIKNGTRAEEICVLFRTHNQASMIKKALADKNIPYSSVRKRSLLEYPKISALRHMANICNKLSSKAAGGGHSWWTLCKYLEFPASDLGIVGKFVREHRDTSISESIRDKSIEGLSPESNIKLRGLIDKMRVLQEHVKEGLSDFFGTAALSLGELNENDRIAVKSFNEYAKEFSEREFDDVETFLAHLDAREQLYLPLVMPESKKEGVNIMTAHATKGLEYDVVIIANLVQGKFPIETVSVNKLIPEKLAQKENQQISEERRLFYVACTRTKKRLYLTYALNYGSKKFEPSQFLNEIDYGNNQDVKFEVDHEQTAEVIAEIKEAISMNKEVTFSPSALNLFASCRKKYEYRYVLNMPEEVSGREQRALGSFIHEVIEFGVKEVFTSERQFMQLAEQLALKPEWAGVNLDEAKQMLKIFFERNREKYTDRSRNEQVLSMSMDGMKFIGYADRIDFHPDGIEIIDYKTGNHVPYGRERDWQLGFYALAAKKLGKVKRVTLDVFKNEKPLEYELDEKGVARDVRSNRVAFSLENVRKELTETAKEILSCYEKGFSKCPAEKNCEFCAAL